MTMTSLLWRHFYLERMCSILPCSSFLLHLASVEQHESNEISEQVQQANVFKRQTLMFHFSTYRPNSCKHLSYHTVTRRFDRMRESTAMIVASVVETTRRHQQHFLDHEQTFYTVTPNMYCWSCKMLVIILYWRISDWMAFALSSFAKCPQQTNNRRLFRVGWFQRQRQRCHNI